MQSQRRIHKERYLYVRVCVLLHREIVAILLCYLSIRSFTLFNPVASARLRSAFPAPVLKSGLVESVLAWVNSKQTAALIRASGVKRAQLSGIPKLDDANEAGIILLCSKFCCRLLLLLLVLLRLLLFLLTCVTGTKTSDECTLILTEGDSAKALAVSGLSVVGRDRFGVFPLRGKLLNARELTPKQLMENAEIRIW